MMDQDATELDGTTAAGQHAVVLVADVLATGLSEEQMTERAARMQQVVGEAVYLYDGRVTDPFGPLLIAEMPDASRAIEATRKARNDLADYNRGKGKTDVVNARLVVHAGEVKTKGESLAGRAVEMALSVLDTLPAKQAAISASALAEAGITPKGAPITALGEAQFFDIPPEVVAAAPEPVAVDAPTVIGDHGEVATKPWSTVAVVGISVAVIILLAAIGWFFAGKKKEKSAAPVVEKPKPKVVQNATFVATRLAVEPFQVGTATPDVAQQVASIRRVTIALLQSVPSIDIVEAGDAELRLGGELRATDTGTLLVPFIVSKEGVQNGQGVDTAYVGSAARGIAWWVGQRVGFHGRSIGSSNDEAMDHFAKAVMLSLLQGDEGNKDAGTEIQSAIDTDPRFVAAYIFAAKYWNQNDDPLRALEMIRKANSLAPDDLGILRRLGRAELSAGNPGLGLDAYLRVLAKIPNDIETLRVIGRHALAVGDANTFNKVLSRLSATDPVTRELHKPDILVAEGDVNRAVGQYYQLETQFPTNLNLSFKIGRIAVLRRSAEIANLELTKLQNGDAGFRYQMLRAYVMANGGDAKDAEDALALAKPLAVRQNWYHTYAAEVYAILGDANKALGELQQAVQTDEPTIEMIETNPLFKFLHDVSGYQQLLDQMNLKKAEIQAKLLTANL